MGRHFSRAHLLSHDVILPSIILVQEIQVSTVQLHSYLLVLVSTSTFISWCVDHAMATWTSCGHDTKASWHMHGPGTKRTSSSESPAMSGSGASPSCGLSLHTAEAS